MRTKIKLIQHLKSCQSTLKTLLLFVILGSFIFKIHAQNTQEWIKIGDRSTNFYEIKEAFLRDNAEKLKQYEQDLKDLSTGKLEALPKGKYSTVKQFMRIAEWYEPRVAESNGDMKMMQEGTYKALLKAQREVQTRAGAANWTLLGPINQTVNMAGNGRVNNLRVDPNNASILYACTPASQLFKSTNGGTSWTSISNGILSTGVTDMAIDPTNSNILYAITGDGDQAIYHPFSTGLYKSMDGGTTWNTTGISYTQGNGVGLTSVLVNPSNSNIILVAGTNGIRRSTDGGATFVQTSTVSTRDLAFNPLNPNTVFAGSKSGGVFLRSQDGGVTWTQILNGLPATGTVRYAVSVSPVDTNYVYAMATDGSSNLQGFYRSTDGGTSFTLMSTTPNIPNGQGWYNLCVAADPSVANTVFAAGLNGYKSTDGGATWVSSSSGVHVDFHDLTFAGTVLYATTDGGVYKSTNNGSTWTNISSNLSIAQLYGLGLSTSNENLIISGHQDNGTNLTSDLLNWRQVSGGDGMISFIDRTNNNNMFCTYQNGVLRKSTNGGTTFSTIYTVPGGYWVTPFIQDPQVATTLYTAGRQVFKSTNSGTTWDSISAFSGLSIRWLEVDKNNTQIVYAMTSSNLYKTTDGGLTWSAINSGLPTSGFLHIHIDVNNSNNLYLSRSSYSGSSVYFSSNGGSTWSLFATGLPNVPANTIVTQQGLSGELYCGTDIGVYYRNGSMTSWQTWNTGMPTVPVRDLEIYYATGKIRAATFGRSIWESPLNSTQPCDPPAGPSVTGITSSAVTVTWSAVSGAVSYTLEYKTSTATTWTAVTGIATTSYNLTGLTASTTYNVRVKTVCSATTSAASTQTDFTTLAPACAATTTPSVSNISTNGATISWTAVTGAVSYTLEYKTSTATTWIAVTGITATSYNLTGLSASTTYNVRITTVCSTESSVPSAQATFTTLAAPTCPTPSRPTVGTTTANTAAITWTAVAGAVSYTLEYKLSTATTWIPINGITATAYTLTGLVANTNYNVRVTAVCATLSSSPSASTSFKTRRAGAFAPDGSTSDNNIEERLTMTLSPNPAQDIVTAALTTPIEGEYTLVLFDILGKKAFLQKQYLGAGENQITISTSQLARGVYNVKVSSNEDFIVQKLLIK